MASTKTAPSSRRVPLVGGPQAAINFHRPDGGVDEIQLKAATTQDPLVVARYCIWACGPHGLDHPEAEGFTSLSPLEVPKRVSNPYNHSPAAAKAYRNMPQFFDPNNEVVGFNADPAIHAMLKKRICYTLEVWPDPDGGPPELAFVNYDEQQQPIKTYQTGRRPAEEVLAILGGPAVEADVTNI